VQPPEAFRRLLLERQSEDRLPSVSAAVSRRGQVVWAHAVGDADAAAARPATPATRYRIGSITKTFTAAAVLTLEEEGAVDLDDPLERHLPGLAAHGSLTIRRLLAHSSGLRREPPGEVWESLSLPTGDELLSRLAETEAPLPPGRYRHYSNLAYALLGELVVRVSGLAYTDFVDQRLIGPLRLARTTWRRPPDAAAGYYVHPYTRTLLDEADLEERGLHAVGSLWSTTSDLCRWADALADREAMHQVQIMDDPETWLLGWGLGLMLFRRGDTVLYGHGGAMPGYLAMLAAKRSERIAAAVLTNASTPAAAVERLALDLVERALVLLPAEPVAWRPESPPQPELADVLGTWWSEGSEFVLWWEGGELRARPAALGGPRSESRFERIGEDRYRVRDGRERGEILRVVRDGTGTPTKLYWATYPFTRTPSVFGGGGIASERAVRGAPLGGTQHASSRGPGPC